MLLVYEHVDVVADSGGSSGAVVDEEVGYAIVVEVASAEDEGRGTINVSHRLIIICSLSVSSRERRLRRVGGFLFLGF